MSSEQSPKRTINATEALRAMRDAGELTRLNPIEKSTAAGGKSLRLAVNAKCFDCVGQDCDPGWRARIGGCPATRCPLHSLRPYRG